MPGLILKLRPHERLLVNGALIENGDRKTRLRVRSEGAQILRLREALRPEDATTPLTRAYYAAQLAVACDLDAATAARLIEEALRQHAGRGAAPLREEAARHVAAGDFYRLMRRLRAEIGPEAFPHPPHEDAAPALAQSA